MPPKRAPKAPPAPARSLVKKAPRPAATKKKQALPKPAAKKKPAAKMKGSQPTNQKPKRTAMKVTAQLASLLHDPSASARSIVDFVVGPTCGLESLHNWYYISMTPFLMAVASNRLDVAQLLVAEHSANTKAMTVDNYTALHIASREGHLSIVRYLVEQCGLDVQALDAHGQSPLHWAIGLSRSDAALLLLELGADPNQLDRSKRTPLSYACQYGLVDVARVLIEKRVNIDALDSNSQSPLYWAISYSPSLHWAIANSHSEVALLLLELGADPNNSNNQGWTPLHWACYRGLVDVARALIAKGASRGAVNKEGKTPRDMAVSCGHREVAALLKA